MTYRNAPPIPERAVTTSGSVLFTKEDVAAGQEVFLKYGLMNNGSVWGHGAYLGPDFTASYLHDMAVDLAGQVAIDRFGRRYDDLNAEEKAAVGGIVALRLKESRYDPATGVLTLPVGDHGFFEREQTRWARYFDSPAGNGGLRRNAIRDDGELKALNAFFAWAAWVTVAQRPARITRTPTTFPMTRSPAITRQRAR